MSTRLSGCGLRPRSRPDLPSREQQGCPPVCLRHHGSSIPDASPGRSLVVAHSPFSPAKGPDSDRIAPDKMADFALTRIVFIYIPGIQLSLFVSITFRDCYGTFRTRPFVFNYILASFRVFSSNFISSPLAACLTLHLPPPHRPGFADSGSHCPSPLELPHAVRPAILP